MIDQSDLVYQLLGEAIALDYSDQALSDLLFKSNIGQVYFRMLEIIQALSHFSKSLANVNDPIAREITLALENLRKQSDYILSFYEKKLDKQQFIGDKQSYESPDIIVILGANPGAAKHRVQKSVPTINRFSQIPLLLSGGGYQFDYSEAQYMETLLNQHKLKNKIILEADSMDTIGNAFFSRLTLKKNQLLSQLHNMLIITSKFHALRAYNIFARIYRCKIAVMGVEDLDNPQRERVLGKKELLSEEVAMKNIFSLTTVNGNVDITNNDEFLLFFNLFYKHELYKNRYDLIRKYYPIVMG